jgi:hypothetical protein
LTCDFAEVFESLDGIYFDLPRFSEGNEVVVALLFGIVLGHDGMVRLEYLDFRCREKDPPYRR